MRDFFRGGIDLEVIESVCMEAGIGVTMPLHGHYTVGRQRLRQLLGLVPGENTLRVRALNGAAWLAIDQGDYPDADRLLGESAELSRRLNDPASRPHPASPVPRLPPSGDASPDADP